MLSASLDGRGVCGRTDTCVCTAESLCRSPETITTLLTGCTPIKNAFGVNKKLKKKFSQAGRLSTWEGKAVSWKARGFVSPPPKAGSL